MNEAHWKRLSPLLDELFELDADARAARLAAIAQDDAALAAELQHLLTVDERSGLLDAGVANAAATVMSQLTAMDPRPAQASPSSGLRIGHTRNSDLHLFGRVRTGNDGDPVVGLLPMKHAAIPDLGQRVIGEAMILQLGFLQAHHVWLELIEPPQKLR